MTTFHKDSLPPPPTPTTLTHNLGVAGSMAKTFIHSPLSPLLLFACLAMGIMGLILTPRQEDPQISVPMVDIFVRYTGASADQVSTLVAEPLERIMSEIKGVKHVYSASLRGQAMVTVEFDVGQDMEASLVKLYDKLESHMDLIPPDVTKPLVKPKAVDDVPVVTLTLWSNDVDDSSLRILALDVLQKLNEVENASQSFVVGGRPEQIRVEVSPERLSGYGITLDQIAQTIRTANSEKGLGSVESSDMGFQVYSGAFLKNAHDVARLMIGTHGDQPIRVRDVAEVFSGPEETQRMVTYTTGPAADPNGPTANQSSAVTIAIAKKKGANGVTVANGVLAKIEELKGRLIPKNVNVAVTRNYGETANEKVNELLFKLLVATMAVTVLVWFALGFKPATVTLIVIPVVILMTVFAALIMGYTIDRVSLFALIFSIGILVDDAIVVVENIYRRWLMEDKCCHLISIDAVREVGNPTILATFTVIAALLPMGFVRGMMGPYMLPIPALGSVAMLFSLFAAFIFTPWLAQLIKPSMRSLHHHSDKEIKSSERLEQFFRWIIPTLLDSKVKGYGFLFLLIGLFFLSMLLFYTTDVTVKILPLDNKPEFNVVINMPEGTAMPKTTNLARRMTQALKTQIPEVTALQTYVGTASPFNFNGMVRHYYLRQDAWQADIQVQLLHKSKRKRTSHDIAIEARKLLTPMAREVGAHIEVVEMPPGPPVLQSVVAEVTGPDADTRRKLARDMEEIFKKSPSLVDVDTYMREPYDIWRFEVDTEKAVRRGITVEAINRNLGMAMGGAQVGDVKRGSVLEPTYIVLQVPMGVRSNISSLSDLPLVNPQGKIVPLGELGRFVKQPHDPIIFHKDLRPVEYVTAEVEGRLDAPIYAMMDVEAMLKNYTAPDGVKITGEMMGPPKSYTHSAFEWTGEWVVTYETFRDMGLAFGVALILIYMLVVWEFGNFVLPAVIMAPIPLTLLGILPGHWLLNAKFTATSMIGFIALAGIIVRNSILLVDFAKQEIMRGTSVRDAVILSCKARTRPIIITALALVAGSSVILGDFIFQGMAISLLFGSLVSTLLTLLVIPLGCVSASHAFVDPEHLPPSRGGGRLDGACEADLPHASAPKPGVKVTKAPRTGILLAIWQLFWGLIFRPKKPKVKARPKPATPQPMAPVVLDPEPVAESASVEKAVDPSPVARLDDSSAPASKSPQSRDPSPDPKVEPVENGAEENRPKPVTRRGIRLKSDHGKTDEPRGDG
ncbi:Multidrug resistance protein MdtB [Candidatus Magnetaquicoccaceae bacterium FCR-1]|uniref:Multidrug resistance protein MdtB n=2 Tax=Candidatus Magnetaquiglobus chichijimensis TaxID=3141448 RepID=A0ABQ0C4N3_9PROT